MTEPSPAAHGARFAHVNLVARDWQALSRFYETVFGCVPVPPDRDLSGPDMDAGTGVAGVEVRGRHLRLPGTDATLEIFRYDPPADAGRRSVNRPGFSHIAFAVTDVAEAQRAVVAHGGAMLGEQVTTRLDDGRVITWCYVADPEGNAVELHAWG